MKIVAGMGTIEDYEEYVRAGADEIFVGYVPYEWQKKYAFFTPLNRREVAYSNVNIGSFSELEILAEKMEVEGVPVAIALNGLHYEPRQYGEILQLVEECLKQGFRDYIIADLGLLIHLHQAGLCDQAKIHISGEFGQMNSYQMEMLEELGAKRIIYHRGVTLSDMRAMIEKFPDMEHEAFYMNENCHFTGAYCNSVHCDELVPMCRMPYKCINEQTGMTVCKEVSVQSAQMGRKTYLDLEEIGITHLKIVGRGAATADMLDDLRMASMIRDGVWAEALSPQRGDFYRYSFSDN